MIARVVRAFFEKPLLAGALALAGASLGALALADLPRDVFPDLSAPVFNVIVQNGSMGAEELETGVVVPLEAGLAGLPGVRRVRSSAQLGVAQVTVEFEADTDYHRARQLVAERVNQAAPDLPHGTEPPLVSSLTGRLNEVFELTLEADTGALDLMALRDYAEFEVRSRLLAVPGVASVETLGGHLRQFQVQLDPDRMSARGVTLDEVFHAIEGASVDAAGGFVVRGQSEWTVRAVGRASDVAELRQTVVTTRGAAPVLLGDVSDVVEAPAVRRGLAHRLAGEVVSCRVGKQFGADTVKVAAGLRAALASMQAGLPPGVRLRVVYDQSRVVGLALTGVGRAVLLGAVLVAAALLLLLGHARAALVVTVTIPLSIGLAGLLLREAGVGLNTMTLGGLAIAVGLLVDAAIIVTENVLHRTAGAPAGERRARALAAAVEVGRPIAFATAIVVAVFLPLFGMQGVEGRMYRPLAAAVVATMSAALALALTLVPVASAYSLAGGRDSEDTWLVRRVKRVYAPLLDRCLRHAGRVRALTLLLTAPALALAFAIGRDFVPRLDEGALLLQTVLPPEAPLDEVDRLNHRVEDALRTVPEVEDVVRRTGRAERTEDPMPHTVSDVLVVLKADRRRPLAGVEEALRGAVAHVPGVSVLFTTPLGMRIDEGLGGSPADVSARVFGPDLAQLQRLAGSVERVLRSVRGLADVRAEAAAQAPQLRIAVDREAAARVGVTPGEVVRAVRVGLAGEEAGQIVRGNRRFDLVVRLRDDRRSDLASIRALPVDGHDGARVPLAQLARIEETDGPVAIRREAGSRRVAVDASVVGRDLAGAAAEVRRRLAAEVPLPPGYFVDVGGRAESEARSTRGLVLASLVAVAAVFVLLYLALGGVAESVVILATLPDAFVGGILALLLTGGTWNVSSLVGLIGLFGIAVQNGLVLVGQTRALVAEGRPFEAALREASLGRVRPKLLTAGTAVLGLLPLLVFPFHGTEIERPLAVVMTGGLVTSTLFTLLALPTFYLFVHDAQQRLRARRAEPTLRA